MHHFPFIAVYLLQAKLEMLESLMEIEIAFNLLKEGDAVKDKDPIDAHYEKLNTEIEVKWILFWDSMKLK